ncbi:MAG: ABC transporter ATP-binding protein [Povalibacter sp.]
MPRQEHKGALPKNLSSPRAFVLHYLRSWRWSFIALLAMVVVAAVCAVVIQFEMKVLVDAMAISPRQTHAAWMALWVFIGLVAVESLMWRLSGWMACRTTIGVGVEMRLDLFRHISAQSMRYFADNLAGSLGHRLTGAAGNFGALTNTLIWRILPPTIDFLGALVIFSLVNWHMAALMAAYVVLVTTALIVFGAKGRPLHSAYAGKSNSVGGELIDVISNMWAVKAFSARDREWQRLREHFNDEATAQRASWMYTEKTRVAYDVVLWIMAAGMLAWAVSQWARGSISPGDVVVVSAMTFRILHGSRDVAISLIDLVQQFGYIDDTLHVIGQLPSINDPAEPKPLQRKGGSLDFRRVSFRYDRGRYTVKDLDLHVPAGQKLGIVGPSGAGKSTLIHLIQRLYEVQRGEILIDGQPVGSLQQDDLRSLLAVVPQEITLFHRSIMDNIRFARPDATDEEVFAASRAAHCDEFVRRLPQQYDTLVGERGVKLSGGQRQRVGIARALLKDAPIIILDEATSALDTESEMRVQHNLIELLEDRTVIAVAHRLSTLVNFERILVLSEGKIVEEGTAQQLIARRGLFDRLWRLQTQGTLAEEVAEEMQQQIANYNR